jgi:Flp pilus assembly protein TadB
MNCPHCGAALPGRARFIMTGLIFIVLALVLLLFVHLPVVVLAAVLLAVVGASLLRGSARPKRCTRCGKQP